MILVTGGAGYIGSHAAAEFIQKGEKVVVIDNLSKGHAGAVLGDVPFYQGDLQDRAFLKKVFQEHEIDAVVHFAAYSLVGESVKQPLDYYQNNVVATHQLISSMVEHGVRKMVFSSTAAVYGEPEQVPIKETAPTQPTNPYGETKLAIEKMLYWCGQAYGLKSISLRYFNAAGAHPDGHMGEDHKVETHLIPIILQVALGQREYISVYGDDYPTEDGTCIRDYIHIMDLANAHWLAIEKLRHSGYSGVYNLGSGTGFSVKQVIDVAREVTGHPIPMQVTSRRPGDPAVLVASSDKARKELGWQPQNDDLRAIIESAWRWHSTHPRGYQG